MTHSAPPPVRTTHRRRGAWWLAAVIASAGVITIVATMLVVGQRPWLHTNVTIPLSYVGEDGKTYSCTYDYRTSDRLPMPTSVADNMNARDWSQTGQLIYEWAKTHPAESWTTQDDIPADDPRSTRPDASWALAMDEYIDFPPWQIETEHGSEYELWHEVRPGATCVDGLR